MTKRLSKNHIRLTFSIAIILIQNINSQALNVNFNMITIDQGLSQSSVYSIAQDKLGYIWFGTQDGLNRYDGYSMQVFKNNPTDTNSISDNSIWSIISDKNGNLWIGTMRGGLNLYSINKNKFYHYKLEDEQKRIIVGVNKYKDKERIAFIYESYNIDILTVHTIRKVNEDGQTISNVYTSSRETFERKYANGENAQIWELRELRNKKIVAKRLVDNLVQNTYISNDTASIGQSYTEKGTELMRLLPKK